MFNDAIDDLPHHQLCAGFEGVDMTTPPALLPPGLLSDGRNIICDGDGLAKNRPGLRLNTFLTSNWPLTFYPFVRGLGYYDLPGAEFLIAYHNRQVWAVPSAGNNVTPQVLFTASPRKDFDCFYWKPKATSCMRPPWAKLPPPPIG
jgi:hypothetical protein